MPETRLWLGESQVIAFQAKAGKESQTLPISIEPASAVEVLQPPAILDGESIGYLRVRGLQPGKATLHVGTAKLALNIAPDPARDATASQNPIIVSPMAGASLWGKVAFGVELPDRAFDSEKPRVLLKIPGGHELEPVASVSSGSTRHFTFEVDADSLPPGRAEFQPIAVREKERRDLGDPVAAMVTRPDPSLMVTGNCAETLDGARPERFGETPPKATKDPKAPGGAYISNSRPDPAWCLPVEIRDPGLYQMMITARGTFAAGCYPSVGLILGENSRAAQAVRISDTAWRRYPIGVPIHFDAGSQILTVRYLNDFSAGKTSDRNLYLANYEWVRVDSAAPAPSVSDASDTTTGSDDPSMTMMMSKSAGGSEAATVGNPPRVTFMEIFDRSKITGPVTLQAKAWWPELSADTAPQVDLLVNDRAIESQRGASLIFRVPVEAFHPGENTVQLRARQAGGAESFSSIQRLIRDPGSAAPSEGPVARFLRFTTVDPAWDQSFAQRVDTTTPDAQAAFYANGESFLDLPNDLSGSFRIDLEARGQEFRGPPVAEILLRRANEEPKSLGRISVRNGWQTAAGPVVQLEPGPKQLVIRFGNDLAQRADAAKNIPPGDRNFWVKALRLEEMPPASAPSDKPAIAIRYPRARQVVGNADAVIADVSTQRGLSSLDLIVDGQPQLLNVRPDTGLGPALFPLLTRSLGDGPHTLRVTATDTAGVRSESDPLTFNVRHAGDDAPRSPYERALFLLNRFGFGPEPSELVAVLTLGEKEWLRQRLEAPASDPSQLAAADDVRTAYPKDNDEGLTIPRAVRQLLVMPNPVKARFTLWAENHFSTWISKAGPLNKWAEHERFTELGPAPFLDLLKASATSPAMLVYLDQKNSFVNRLNENYAREIMELHTLGVHGGYTQRDVTTLAKQLNGWTLSDEAGLQGVGNEPERTFRFSPELSDNQPRRILGMEFPTVPGDARYDSVLKALEMLAAHPSTARFISEKLAQQYVSDPAPPKLVDDLTKVFLRSGGDMRAMLTAIAAHPDFWKAAPKISTPLDFSLRFGRLAGSRNSGAVADFLRRSGMGLFDRATPDGYPEADDNYVNSNALLQRWRFAKVIQADLRPLVPAGWVPPPKTPLSNSSAQRLVDLVAVRFTGQPLTDTSNDAAVKYLLAASQTDPDRVKLITSFIAQLPELSLR
ncbi:MAG TPA: DUF1800 family protein [Chthoniobacterales bacterium]|nr:DUF1800 family protein [Chthoniobacterales bacterium]